MAETVKVLVPEEDVAKRIKELGEQISKDYAGKQVHLICVLKGRVFFMCDVVRRNASARLLREKVAYSLCVNWQRELPCRCPWTL